MGVSFLPVARLCLFAIVIKSQPVLAFEIGRRNTQWAQTSHRERTLNELHARKRGIDLPYEDTIEALRIYYARNKHLILPRRFAVPDSDKEYPSAWRGLDLASTVYDMRWWQKHVKQRPSRVAELNEMGFVWERLQPEWNLILEALISFGTIHNHLLVPASFFVPFGDSRWPKATWGLSLGKSVQNIRNRGDYVSNKDSWRSRRDQLDAIGFVWDVQEYKFSLFYHALRIFKNLHGVDAEVAGQMATLCVPTTFVIPTNSPDWPRELWGYNLGEKCTAVRRKGLYIKDNPERQARLIELGFRRGGNADVAWLKVVHAAAVYSQLHNRSLDVPVKFVVPAPPHIEKGDYANVVGSDEAWPWPEYLWGFPLGQRLKDIRVNGAYMKGEAAGRRRKQLDALGFVWKPKRGRPVCRTQDRT